MLRTFGRLTLFLAFFSLAGGHWAVLHSLAWASMIREYSTQGSLIQAVAQTFGNQAPCHICHHAAGEQQSEDPRSHGPRTDHKTELSTFANSAMLSALSPTPYTYPPDLEAFHFLRSDEPPQPVPRLS